MQAKNKAFSGFSPFLKNLFRWINILLIFATLITYVSPLINPATLWHFSFPGLVYPYLLLGHIFFILFWLWRRDWYVIYSTGCVLVGFGYFSSLLGFHLLPPPEAAGNQKIRIMTYNVAGLRRFDERKKEEQELRKEQLQQLKSTNEPVDILCIQEGASSLVSETLRKAFGFTHYYKYKGTIIFSRYPFVGQDNLDFGETTNSCIWADLKTPAGIVRVYSVHLQSNWLAGPASRLMNDHDPSKTETWKGVGQIMRLYKRAVTRRAHQAELVAAHIAQSPHPVILTGDFNDTPVSYVYQTVSEGLQDSFRERGRGFDFTYNGKIPGLRIDYVFCSKNFNVIKHRVPKSELSDHFPVLVTLQDKRETD